VVGVQGEHPTRKEGGKTHTPDQLIQYLLYVVLSVLVPSMHQHQFVVTSYHHHYHYQHKLPASIFAPGIIVQDGSLCTSLSSIILACHSLNALPRTHQSAEQ
jgi:hypothetical protein